MAGIRLLGNLIHHRIASVVSIMIIILMVFPQALRSVEEPLLSHWYDFSTKPECKKLIQWMHCQARARLTGRQCNERFESELPGYYGRLGVFVTLQKRNKVRGCFGAFFHGTTDAVSLLSDYLTGALTRDPRYSPLDVSELADTRILITVASQPFPVEDVHSIDTRYFGIVLICGNDTAVYVPAEIKSVSYIEKKLKDASCQVSAFKAVTLQ